MSRSTRRTIPRTRGVAAITLVVAMSATACGGSDRREAESGGGAQGVTDEAIKIGGSFPFSGPYAVFSNASQAIAACFAAANEDGGVNGRQIEYTAADDAYDPARLTANAREAVEQEQVAAFISFGGTNVAIQPYMNESQVPHIVLAGNAEFSRVDEFPFTHAWWPDLSWEAEAVTSYVMDHPEEFPAPEIGLISLNNTLADSHIAGIEAGLGGDAATVFPEENRLRVEPTLADWTSQLNQLQAAGVNVLYMNPGTAGQANAIKYIDEIGWPVKVIVYSGGTSIKTNLEPAGLDAAEGIYGAAWLKDPSDSRWADDEGIQRYREVIEQYGEGADPDLTFTANGYGACQAVLSALESIGDEEITSEAFNEAWMAIDGEESDVLVPGADLIAGESGRLVHDYQMLRFDGTSWEDVGELIDVYESGITE
ncbi:ABC transporter substrate-binding protein [Blastococcus haudaquaticus]|uniref:Amino acid/amide ABC transporter substrate-binding protein, HAAT family n=1 Tax=Blastococcus haudaquaticus TaxID=1938745 RepID=A0A286GRS8_9ACTN|nr:ABC transporter substrate-binding protein [Blastococcus haudaquaticus]SOD97759.1 amino acid/amide ABC transporter substrate-binding protein, HAAT family [Blastococcus haudaquaticus]